MDESRPDFTCSPPVWSGKFVERCLASLVVQTAGNLEILIVDDASADRSIEVVERFARRDRRIRILRHTRNRGLMAARHTGFSAAAGKYIVFCDTDDHLPPDGVEILYRAALSSGADIVYGDYTVVNRRGKRLPTARKRCPVANPVEAQKAILRQEMSCVLWGAIFRRELLCDFPYHILEQVRIQEDHFLMQQLLKHARSIDFVQENVYYYEWNRESCTRKTMDESDFRQALTVIGQLFSILTECEIPRALVAGFVNRNIAIYLERGHSWHRIVQVMPQAATLYTFSQNRSAFGWRRALHGQLLKSSVPYSFGCRTGRKILRYLLGR